MATLTIAINSGSATTTTTLTFAGTDAQRILSAYQAKIKSGGTQADLTQFLALQAQSLLNRLVTQNERVDPTLPQMTSVNS